MKACLATLAMTLSLGAFQPQFFPKQPETQYAQAWKERYRRYVEEVFNHRDLDLAEKEYWAPDLRDRSLPLDSPQGAKAARAQVEAWFKAFPDSRFEVEDVMVEGGRLAARLLITGTQQGEFFGIPATGRRVAVHETLMYATRGGRFTEIWSAFDTLGLLRQLGVGLVPPKVDKGEDKKLPEKS